MLVSIFGMLSTAVVVLVTTLVALLAWQRSREKRLLKLAPRGDLGFWLVGEMLSDYLVNPQRFFAQRASRHESKNFTSHTLLSPVVLIGDLEDRDQVLAYEREGKAMVQWPSHFRAMMGPGSVTTVTGEDHTRLRRLFAPHFMPQAIARYVDVVDSAVLKWLDNAAEGKYHSTDDFRTLTMDVFLETMFGGNATREEMVSMQRDFGLFLGFTFSFVPVPLGEFNTLGRALNARKRLRSTMETIVARLKSRGGGDNEGKSNLLESLINAEEENGNGLTHDELMNNLIMFGFAGFDTTAAAMSSLIAMLFSSPDGAEYLAKLREEVKEHVQPGDLNTDVLKTLPWMNAVVNEVLRYKNPINGGFRMALEDLPLKDGAIIPQGACFMSYATASNFNEEYWGANATAFNPERFLKLKDGGGDVKYNFVAFGRGSRICPGEQLAKLELRLFAVRLAQKYAFEVKDTKEVGLPMCTIQSKFTVTKL